MNMKPQAVIVVLAVLFALSHAGPSANSKCKPVGTQEVFSLEEFTRTTWYVQQQQAIKYLPAAWNYCVTADYKIKNKKNVDVHNVAHEGSPTGTAHVGNLCAVVRGNSKLAVGPCFLPSFLYGDYWVVATGKYVNDEPVVSTATTDAYDWALISGGQPTVETPNGCKNTDGVNGAGLWIFTRTPTVSDNVVRAVRKIAEEKGFDTSVLQNVQQTGCKYSAPESLPELAQAIAEAYPALAGTTDLATLLGSDVIGSGGLGASTGACDNDADKAALAAKGEAGIRSAAKGCALKCVGGEACAANCAKDSIKISAACSTCFGKNIGCVLKKCAFGCALSESKCNECQKSNCQADFISCGGNVIPQ